MKTWSYFLTIPKWFLDPVGEVLHKRSDLAEVIIEIGDVRFVPKLIQNLRNINNESEEYEFLWESEKILASFESNDVVEQLISYAVDNSQKNFLRECCTGALSESKGRVELSIFERLVKDENLLIRRKAINGLRKYPNSQIKEILFKNMNDEDGWIQHDILEILGEKGLLVELIKNNL